VVNASKESDALPSIDGPTAYEPYVVACGEDLAGAAYANGEAGGGPEGGGMEEGG